MRNTTLICRKIEASVQENNTVIFLDLLSRAAERAEGARGKAFTHESRTNLLVGMVIN